MQPLEAEQRLVDSMQSLSVEVKSILYNSPFNLEQLDTIEKLMNQVFITLEEFRNVIEKLAED